MERVGGQRQALQQQPEQQRKWEPGADSEGGGAAPGVLAGAGLRAGGVLERLQRKEEGPQRHVLGGAAREMLEDPAEGVGRGREPVNGQAEAGRQPSLGRGRPVHWQTAGTLAVPTRRFSPFGARRVPGCRSQLH